MMGFVSIIALCVAYLALDNGYNVVGVLMLVVGFCAAWMQGKSDR